MKPTQSGRSFIKDVVEAPPYRGAKPGFLIENRLEDREWISHLVRITMKKLSWSQLTRRKSKKKMGVLN